ncbi:hypothetical protein HN51_065461 [Arachis hypogaea]|uniref:polynucleotide adenylyltransferase n=1 Tax=Arachis hypogaea TaxID=3818 RepID=A0A444ZEU1_ARAHY|nr:nuclear poly(A) polymerase 3 [Arachis ipaensis]QHO06607.1 Nuclear poly(A) polymerase [Arachis hypogaea]RYR12638.1 hypothetical protein Ahy_B04g070082 [Arachis hypogaea]
MEFEAHAPSSPPPSPPPSYSYSLSGVVLDPPIHPPPPTLPPPPPPPFLRIDPSSGVLVPPPQPFPFNLSLIFSMDHQRSMSLLQFMADEGLVPSVEEEERRKNAIQKLKQIVSTWIKQVAVQRRLPKHQIAATSATVLTYGSYGLGVHSADSDIDALCVAPYFATLSEDFFVVLHDMLKSRPEVSELYCVKSAKVPLMRFKFDGISIDLPYACLKVLYVPESVDILHPFFLRNIDDTSWKSLSGVRANKRILQLVPNVENFQAMVRCLKLWAKRRGVYGTLHGYLGGVHLAILAAYVCQRHPDASINALIMNFFRTFAFWSWPSPVTLQEGMFLKQLESMEMRSFMPILLPSSPYEFCHSNITKSTFYRIRTEFVRGYNMTRDLLKPGFTWDNIFELFPYSRRYSKFVKIYLSTTNQCELGDWVGWVKSRFRSLLIILEGIQGFCDPNPTEYTDPDKSEPNMVFYWGLQSGRNNYLDIELVEGEFMKVIRNGCEGTPGRLELHLLSPSQLPKNAQFDDRSIIINNKGRKACWKMVGCDKKRSQVYPQHHIQHCLVGHVSSNGEGECLSSSG